jgi:hypothetical protein
VFDIFLDLKVLQIAFGGHASGFPSLSDSAKGFDTKKFQVDAINQIHSFTFLTSLSFTAVNCFAGTKVFPPSDVNTNLVYPQRANKNVL